MKRFFLILSFIITSIHAQSRNTVKKADTSKVLDTLNYLKTNFEVSKSQYVGKPFSYLLSKMTKIQPRTVWNIPGSTDNSTIEKTLFRFYDMNYPILNETKMLITWRTGLSYKMVDVYSKRNKYYFTNAERRLYGNLIIENILIYR
jgi:hypothetical protein